MEQSYESLSIMHQTIEMEKYIDYSFQRISAHNVHIQECTFTNCFFSRANLVNLRIANCIFINCKFLNADLSFCKFSNCTFKECDFSLAEIENNSIYKSVLVDTKFIGARLANNTFTETSFTNVDLNGSTTKFNSFEETEWIDSIFGNCTIDYNIATRCIFKSTKMNLETLGSVWGIQEESLEQIIFLSLGREIIENPQNIYQNYMDYLEKKRLCLEIFTYNVSFKKEDIYYNLQQLLNNLDIRYSENQYLTPDELRFFYEILKVLRKESLLPLLVLKHLIEFIKNIINKISTDDNYYETMLLFYNNICLIYNSMINELVTYQYDLLEDSCNYKVKITFKERPKQNVVDVFNALYQYVYGTPIYNVKFLKDAEGSYIIWLIMPLAALAAFNIGTLLLTGGVKHLIKLRASTEVLFSKKLPRKYYLDVYEKDDSEELAKGIIAQLLSGKIFSLPSHLQKLSSDGVNANNIENIYVDKDNTPVN